MTKISHELRMRVFERDRWTCVYCGEPVSELPRTFPRPRKRATLDHVKPKSIGGRSTETNLVTACQECNERKADKVLAGSDDDWRPKLAEVMPDWLRTAFFGTAEPTPNE